MEDKAIVDKQNRKDYTIKDDTSKSDYFFLPDINTRLQVSLAKRRKCKKRAPNQLPLTGNVYTWAREFQAHLRSNNDEVARVRMNALWPFSIIAYRRLSEHCVRSLLSLSFFFFSLPLSLFLSPCSGLIHMHFCLVARENAYIQWGHRRLRCCGSIYIYIVYMGEASLIIGRFNFSYFICNDGETLEAVLYRYARVYKNRNSRVEGARYMAEACVAGQEQSVCVGNALSELDRLEIRGYKRVRDERIYSCIYGRDDCFANDDDGDLRLDKHF